MSKTKDMDHNMRNNIIPLVLILTFLVSVSISCDGKINKEKIEVYKNEIYKVERDFVALVEKEGIQSAFVKFAADNAVLMRNDKLIKGKLGINDFYSNKKLDKVKLTWEVDFADVSSSGDLAYTYGNYLYITVDSLGKNTEVTGIFHTVWKRQLDSSWKYVWD